jgi:dienelactone hydrolase
MIASEIGIAQADFDVEFSHTDRDVFATFSIPEGDGPFPTVIINPGSGAADRDGTLPLVGGNINCLYPGLAGSTLRYYKQLGEALVDSGFAVLRYDKLEYSYPNDLGTISFEKLWLPVNSAIDYIKTREEVDTSAIVLIGHSEGSTMIPLIARDRDDVRALISLAGPRTPLDTLLAFQLVDFERRCDGDTITAQVQANQVLAYFDLIRSGEWNVTTPPAFGVPANVWDTYVKVADSVSVNYDLADLPTLFIGLEDDINVPPAELLRFESEVSVAEDFWLIEGLNHFLTPADDPNVSMALTDTIVYWLRQLDLTSSIELPEKLGDVDVFPNPASDRITVRMSGESPVDVELCLYDMQGRLVVKNTLRKPSGVYESFIDCSGLESGMYVVEYTSSTGRDSRKVFVQ